MILWLVWLVAQTVVPPFCTPFAGDLCRFIIGGEIFLPMMLG